MGLCIQGCKKSCKQLPTPPCAPCRLALFPHHPDLKRGEVPEWSNGAVSKTVVGVTPPRVRIPVSPPHPFTTNPCLAHLRLAFAGLCRYGPPELSPFADKEFRWNCVISRLSPMLTMAKQPLLMSCSSNRAPSARTKPWLSARWTAMT